MRDLDELKKENEVARWREMMAETHAALPWYSRAVFRLTIWWIHYRECVRDLLLLAFRRPLYVRCAQFCKPFRPCHRDATRTPFSATDMPILCADCDTVDGCPDGIEVGRWHRGPCWMRGDETYRRMVRPEGKPLGWSGPS